MAQRNPSKVARFAKRGAMITLLTGASIGASLAFGWIPGVNVAVAGGTHALDRWRNSLKAKDELDARAGFYREQIANQLGMNPADVTGKDLELAAQLNPQLASVVREVERQKSNENRSSLYASAAGAIPLVGSAASVSMKTAALSVGAAMGGGVLASLMNKDSVDPQMVAEAINEHLANARAQGLDARAAAKPELVFMLRVAQDEQLGTKISDTYGKAFHKMSEAEQRVVMQTYPELAASAEAEAYAVASDMLPVQELVASNASSGGGFAARVRQQAKASSFVAREEQRRAMAQRVADIPSV